MIPSELTAETAADDRLTAHPDVPVMPDMSESYVRYISSGLYDWRYPRPNRRTLRTLKRSLPAGGRFLDVGGGTGRYTLPLLQIAGTSGIAHDICSVARGTLAERMREFVRGGRLVIRGDDPDVLAAEHPQAFDLALLAFGVLAHVAGHAERLRLLRAVCRMVKPNGVLVLGVPNARRRFRAEQRAAAALVTAGELEPGDVLYRRGEDDNEIKMFYHLYTFAEVHRDLSEAGFRVDSLEPESLLSESRVVGSPLLGWLDDLACRLVPASVGYGLLAVGRPRAVSASSAR